METCFQITSQNTLPPFHHYCPQVSCQVNSIYLHKVRGPSVICTALKRQFRAALQRVHNRSRIRVWGAALTCILNTRAPFLLCFLILSIPASSPSLSIGLPFKRVTISKISSIIITVLCKEVLKIFFSHEEWKAWVQSCVVCYGFIRYCIKGFVSPGDHEEYTEVFLLASPEF